MRREVGGFVAMVPCAGHPLTLHRCPSRMNVNGRNRYRGGLAAGK